MNKSPLTLATKEAIKVALSVVLVLTCAMYFGWAKTYWSVFAIIVLSINETFGHSIRKGRNRIIGSLCGALFSLILISLLPQNHLLFLIIYTLWLGFCVMMSSHKKYGYAFTIALVVSTIVCFSGNIESQAVFNIVMLRIEETILGVVVFSLVFRFIWPNDTEQVFFTQYENVVANLRQAIIKIIEASEHNVAINPTDSVFDNQQQLTKLQDILSVPLSGSFELQHHYQQWKNKVKACVVTQHQIDQISVLKQQGAEYEKSLCNLKQLIMFAESTEQHSRRSNLLNKHYQVITSTYSKYNKTLKERILTSVKAISIFVTSALLWIYIPIPSGFIMPMIAGIFSCYLTGMPKSILKHVFIGIVGWSLLILAEYVFVMPMFTEFWQLGLFYFINIFLIWKVCSSPKMALHKFIASYLMVILPMSALQLTPSYGIVMPLTMLMTVFMVLGVITFYSKLFDA